MSDLLKESAEIRKKTESLCRGNKDEMIGVLAMQVAIERRKNTVPIFLLTGANLIGANLTDVDLTSTKLTHAVK